ncbi:preprotein translocase subunit SecA [Chloroflexota bacterium]
MPFKQLLLKLITPFIETNEKALNRLQPIVELINELEPDFEKLTDDELRAKTDEFKNRVKNGASLDELLPEAFAAVREATKRTLDKRHFDVQLLGGIALHQGKIAEMKTGEGKTLVATLPLYLNSLNGKGCHLVTVNDYLARRDPYWMSPIYHALGVSVASIYPKQTTDEDRPSRIYDPNFNSGDKQWVHFRPVSRREAYQADITYGTSSEFGFDYLRDNMASELSRYAQGELSYAIVDEIDNLLIDEARTPLIISGQAEESSQIYRLFAKLIKHLHEGADYIIDEKNRVANLTDNGINNMESLLRKERVLKSSGLYDPENHTLNRHLSSALKAHVLYNKDREYMVRDGQIYIVDEFTGRAMLGRRYSGGLHQAIEAKENVEIRPETVTHATITVQNYFRMYEKLSGMTGTALTEAEEFHKIYNLEVLVIPTNMPVIREDHSDRIFRDESSKFKAVVREVEELHKKGTPILIGTISIEKSEDLSGLLKRRGIPHEVLSARYHEREAVIISQAGRPGAVTVATNMAGRGVDIILGGSPEGLDETEWQKKHDKVISLGGLHIIGTERHESRRIDNQLRGRSGRQGDPGGSRFYISLDDDIVRRFGGDRIKNWVGPLMEEDHPIENKMINSSIEGAQVRVEGYHFDMRKNLVEYDNVVNTQRELIYKEREKILQGTNFKSNILTIVKEEIQTTLDSHLTTERGAEQNYEELITDIAAIFPLPPEITADSLSKMKVEQIESTLIEQAEALYEQREAEMGETDIRILERLVMLHTIDDLWREHLTAMDSMRREAGWQQLRQIRPLDAYKKEGYRQFQLLLSTIQHNVARTIYHIGLVKKESRQKAPAMVHAGNSDSPGKQPKVKGKKVGRNEPCPCGSGKKFKHCCGK